jgi:hypothetical protein
MSFLGPVYNGTTISICFADATPASAFVAPWFVGGKVEDTEACSKFARMGRSRELGRDRTGSPESEESRGPR